MHTIFKNSTHVKDRLNFFLLNIFTMCLLRFKMLIRKNYILLFLFVFCDGKIII